MTTLGILCDPRPGITGARNTAKLPKFDRYYQLFFCEGMSTLGFAGRTAHLGDYLNQMVIKLQATQRSDERRTGLMSPVFNPPVIISGIPSRPTNQSNSAASRRLRL